MAESRVPVLDVDYHYRETSDMRMEKENSELFYNLRHLKTFRDMTGNDNGGIWSIMWKDGSEPMIYNDRDKSIAFYVSDIHLAEYIVSLNNMIGRLIKEVESKYE
jgi:hypothetical protein